MEKITFKKFAELVLEHEKRPLSPLEIWERGNKIEEIPKIETTAKTPWLTIGAQIYVDIRDNEQTIFYQYSDRPARFYLKKYSSDFIPNETFSDLENDESNIKVNGCKERDLHKLLVKFADLHPNFRANVKTIYHEVSSKGKSGSAKWLYPDLVGVHLPFSDFVSDTLQVQRELYWTAVRFFSFEMKINIDIGNLREYYFQAVSNSSWANEGYLVALKIIDSDGKLMPELKRLNNTFGIGVIELNPEKIEESKILFPSKIRDELSWDMVDVLLTKNPDFKKFMEDVKGDIKLGKIANKANYDPILEDDEFDKYVKDKKILE
ncbi:MAG: HTH domain-containing protein [Candidatus Cloacimonetes bacterium]|nr:HTH domain-containing protein [Candidatus Cloacimonadota bacterium]